MDKPVGPTSHDVVTRIRRTLGIRAAGHTGTLDPFASGLLVVLLGRATRLARFVEPQAKTYLASARLGIRTTTDDLTGEPLPDPGAAGRAAEPPSRRAVEQALEAFRGAQTQRPPAFSARRVGGERSYRLARRGIAVELPESPVLVQEIELVEYDYPELVFRTTVSAGTYVRALARDLGEALGSGAHLVALRREKIGALDVGTAVPLGAIEPGHALLPPVTVLGHLPQLTVGMEAARALGFGQAIPVEGATEGPAVVVLGEAGQLLAVGRIETGVFHPEVVLEPAGA